MKKISLKSVKSEEYLSREELKQVLGGNLGSGSGNFCHSIGLEECYCHIDGKMFYMGCLAVSDCFTTCVL
jgi:hypothetical protein